MAKLARTRCRNPQAREPESILGIWIGIAYLAWEAVTPDVKTLLVDTAHDHLHGEDIGTGHNTCRLVAHALRLIHQRACQRVTGWNRNSVRLYV